MKYFTFTVSVYIDYYPENNTVSWNKDNIANNEQDINSFYSNVYFNLHWVSLINHSLLFLTKKLNALVENNFKAPIL